MIPSKADYFEAKQKSKSKSTVTVRLAAVTQVTSSGRPIIRFLGEETAREKQYPYISSYVAKVGDIVEVLQYEDKYIIQGKVV